MADHGLGQKPKGHFMNPTFMPMKRLILAAVAVCLGAAPKVKVLEDDFTIDDFDFTWNVASSGEARLSIRKDEDSTTVCLHRDFGAIRLLPADAVKLGKALAKTSKVYARFKDGKKEMRETVEAGSAEVDYAIDAKYGFRISVSVKDGAFIGNHLSLERADAKAFVPHLLQAEKMCAYLDKKIKL